MKGCRGCRELGDTCPACERAAEVRAEAPREVETVVPAGLDPDYHFPRGYGGIS